MCLHRHNISDLKENIDLLASLGLAHVKMNVASATGRWKNETEHFLTQDEANQAIIDYIPQYVADGMPVSAQFCGFIDFNKERRKILIPSNKFGGGEGVDKGYACGAVTNGMYISPTGKVLPCMTLNETVIDPMFPSILEKPLAEILSDSFYHEMSLLKMRACIEHNAKCRGCKYRLNCGAGCRACACGETSDDYLGIDEDDCSFFQNGWFEKAVELQERYKDSFPPVEEEPAAAAEPAAE
jgi:radical SAM protein with 4Fe4S-binding SPASM domain